MKIKIRERLLNSSTSSETTRIISEYLMLQSVREDFFLSLDQNTLTALGKTSQCIEHYKEQKASKPFLCSQNNLDFKHLLQSLPLVKIHFANLSYSKIMSRASKNYGIEKTVRLQEKKSLNIEVVEAGITSVDLLLSGRAKAGRVKEYVSLLA